MRAAVEQDTSLLYLGKVLLLLQEEGAPSWSQLPELLRKMQTDIDSIAAHMAESAVHDFSSSASLRPGPGLPTLPDRTSESCACKMTASLRLDCRRAATNAFSSAADGCLSAPGQVSLFAG